MNNLTLILLTFLLAFAPAQLRGQFACSTNADGTLTITNYTGPGGNVTFPTTINGLTVTGIGSQALINNSTLTAITIPGGITNLGSRIFLQCSNLTDAILGDGITSIPSDMFAFCGNLTNLTLPNSVTSIGIAAFLGSGISSFSVPPGVTSISGAFIGCQSLTNISLPIGLTNLDDAFSGCSNLPSVTIPPNITGIGADTFSFCVKLTNVVIPGNVTSISDTAFEYCASLQSITIPAGVTNIPAGTYSSGRTYNQLFEGCNSLTNLTILGDANIGAYAFYGFPALTTVSIAGGNIENYAFQNCLNLKSVILGNGVNNIGEGAFQYCTNLTTLTLGNGLTNLGDFAFISCPISSGLFISSNVTYIGLNTFEGCRFTNLVVGNGVDVMGAFAFYGDAQLTNVLFLGNSPVTDPTADNGPFGACPATVYYLPGKTGWSNTFGGLIWGYYNGAPTALWNPLIQTNDGHFGVSHGGFGFNITNGGSTNIPIAVMVCTNLSNPVWTPLTNVMLTNTYYFTDAQWTNYPSRYYGIGFP